MIQLSSIYIPLLLHLCELVQSICLAHRRSQVSSQAWQSDQLEVTPPHSTPFIFSPCVSKKSCMCFTSLIGCSAIERRLSKKYCILCTKNQLATRSLENTGLDFVFCTNRGSMKTFSQYLFPILQIFLIHYFISIIYQVDQSFGQIFFPSKSLATTF